MARTRIRRGAEDTGAEELSGTLKEIKKRYGDSTIVTGGDIDLPIKIPTGVFPFDYYTLGGFPLSRASMVVGERHAGKSLLASKATWGAQRVLPDSKVAYIDVEGTFDPTWASKLGVNVKDVIVFQPETGESAVDATDALINTKEVSLVIIDSIAALTPMKEVESSAEDALVGLQSKLVASMVRKSTSSMIKERRRGHDVGILFINQYRAKIGGFAKFGEPKSIPGGRALEFCTSLQAVIKNKENMGKDDIGMDSVSHNDHSFSLTKNKLNGGGRSGEFRVMRKSDPDLGLNEGDVDDAEVMLSVAKKWGALTGKSNSWTLAFFDYEINFRGMAEAVRYLYANRDVYWDLRNFLIASYAESLGMPQSFVERFLE